MILAFYLVRGSVTSITLKLKSRNAKLDLNTDRLLFFGDKWECFAHNFFMRRYLPVLKVNNSCLKGLICRKTINYILEYYIREKLLINEVQINCFEDRSLSLRTFLAILMVLICSFGILPFTV